MLYKDLVHTLATIPWHSFQLEFVRAVEVVILALDRFLRKVGAFKLETMHLNAVQIVRGENFANLFYEFFTAVSNAQAVDFARLHTDDMAFSRCAL